MVPAPLVPAAWRTMGFWLTNRVAWRGMLNAFCSVVTLWGIVCVGASSAWSQPVASKSEAFRMIVPLPLNSANAERLKRELSEIGDRPNSGERHAVILEFVPLDGKQQEGLGKGTSFEAALGIARWLTSPSGSRVRSIAYVPQSLQGHALLIALACEEIAMAPDATLSRAAIDERSLDLTVSQAYRDINQRRQAFPAAAIESLLDPTQELYSVEMRQGGSKIVGGDELKQLRQDGNVLNEVQIGVAGQAFEANGKELRNRRWVSHLVQDRSELAHALQLATNPIDPTMFEGPWKPAVVQVHGNVSRRSVNQVLRAMEDAQRHGANWFLIDVRSAGGSVEDSLRLAQVIASFDKKKVRSVGWISGPVRGDATLIPLACDLMYVAEAGLLGGVGESSIKPHDVAGLRRVLQDLSEETGRAIGEYEGPLCSELKVSRYTNEDGAQQWASDVSMHERKLEHWIAGEPLAVGDGLSSQRLLDLRWARAIAEDRMSIATEFGIETLPEPRQSNPVEMFVQRLAEQSWLPPILITIGFMALIMELSTPGATVPGFVSALCFLLFFWIRFLNGTVEWLEVLLFFGGALALAIELFALPGFGIFGFGGIIMLFSSVILASQTFIWPTNAYQINEMAWNMSQVAGACIGIGIGLFLIRNQLDNLPMFRWLRLRPAGVEDVIALEERESVVHFEHLAGKTGVTLTKCVPSGKAQIGDSTVNVLADGMLLEEGQPVRVTEVRGNTIVVVPLNR